MNFSNRLLLLFVLLLTKTFAAGAPGENEYAVISARPASPLSWGDFVDIQLGGTPNPNWLDAKNWILRLNGVPVAVGRIYPAGTPGIYRFAIIRPSAEPGEAGALDHLAISALAPKRFISAKSALTLEYSKTALKPAGEAAIFFGLISYTRLTIFTVVALLIAVGIWFTGWKTGVLRDNEPRLPPTERPFSLARVQLALWMVLIGVSFILLYLLTGQSQNVLNSTAVALLGISSVTALASAAAGDPKPASGSAPATVPPTWAVPPAPATATGPLLKHTGLITDIISDANGANLHRVQMAMWTLVLGTVYVFETWTTLTLPTFDPQTFALMGISSTTYVWFKQKE